MKFDEAFWKTTLKLVLDKWKTKSKGRHFTINPSHFDADTQNLIYPLYIGPPNQEDISEAKLLLSKLGCEFIDPKITPYNNFNCSYLVIIEADTEKKRLEKKRMMEWRAAKSKDSFTLIFAVVMVFFILYILVQKNIQ